jgi:hypothetical protein
MFTFLAILVSMQKQHPKNTNLKKILNKQVYINIFFKMGGNQKASSNVMELKYKQMKWDLCLCLRLQDF